MTMPNFLIIGTAKAGTTSLYKYLGQHPEIYMSPQKEPRFFVYDGEEMDPSHPIHAKTITNLKSYQKLFEEVTGEKAIGEASPAYLVEPKAPERIYYYVPNAKIIAILRNPAERAYSHFLHLVKHNYETCFDFGLSLRKIEELKIGSWVPRRDYLLFGFYSNNLKRYYDIFDKKQIKILLFDDLKLDPMALIQETLRFLEVDDTFVPDISIHHSVSGIPKSRALQKFILEANSVKTFVKPFFRTLISKNKQKRLEYWLMSRNMSKPEFPQEVRSYLIDLYREDILNLQELIQRDLSVWLKCN